MDSDSDSEPPKKSRRSFTLRVAMKFPTKNVAQKKSPSPEPAPKPKGTGLNSDEEDFIAKRALNIKENKAMVWEHATIELWLKDIQVTDQANFLGCLSMFIISRPFKMGMYPKTLL